MLLYYGIILAAVIGLSASALSDDKNTNLRRNANFEEYACHTPACHELAHDIQHSMNKSTDPCIDFYEYGCGNWEKNKPADELALNPIQYKTYRRVHELLVEENEYDKIPLLKNLKQFHRSCIDEDAVENKGLEPIKLLLDATGGWPILMSNEEWYQKNYTWQNISNFYYRFYGLGNFFKITYKRVGQNNNRHIILIHPLVTYLTDKIKDTIYHFKYSDFMIKTVRAFAVDKKVQISEKKLSADVEAVLKFHRNLTNIVKYRRKRLRGRKEIMTIAQLQEFYDFAVTQNSSAKIKWLDMIQSTFKDFNISINASQLVRVPNRDFLHIFAYLLNTTQSHIIVNYIQWNIVSQLMRYLNKQVRNIEFEYYSRHNVTGQEARWLTCLRSFPMKDIASTIFIKKYISTDTSNAVLEMIDKIKEELKRKISHVYWMRHKTRNYMIDKIDKISVQMGYPAWYDDQTEFFNLYEELKMGKDYFENWLAFDKFESKRALLDIYTKVNVGKSTDDWPIYLIKLNDWYSDKHNIIVIPAAFIQEPYFTSNTPLAVNYGAIGSIIAHEFVRSVDFKNIGMLPEAGESGDMITANEEFLNYVKRSLCLVEQYENYTRDMRDKHGKPRDESRIMNELFVDYPGIQVVFAAFQKIKKKMRLYYGSKLTTMNVTGEQLFFLSLANVRCTSIRRFYEGDTVHTSIYIPVKFRINGILANVADFSEAFKCPVSSPMNPASKCKFWE